MFCEHPTCSLEANTTCIFHCHLTVCQQHRFEHEKRLLNKIEQQLDELSSPISTLLQQSQCDLRKSEESRQQELNLINSLFDSRLLSIDERLKLAKTTNELIAIKREQLIQCKCGATQLTKEDYQQIKNLSSQIQNNLHEQDELTNQIRNYNFSIKLWPMDKQNHASTEIECIEISDSDDELLPNPVDVAHQDRNETMDNTSIWDANQIISDELNKKRKTDLWTLRDFCPLTKVGVFGLNLNSSLEVPRLCSSINNKRRYLYVHFTRTHRIESSIALQLLKAIQNNSNPMETIIFPQDNSKAFVENIKCPFDITTIEFMEENSIPNTPCDASIGHYYFKSHLHTVHSITKANSTLIYNAIKDYGNISHLKFGEDLCEVE
ncbi:unnamed protein product [Rotaria socialis]